jgi:hypothetical protein
MESHMIDRIEEVINQEQKQRFIELIDDIVEDLVDLEGFEQMDVASYLSDIIRERLVG